MVIVFLLEHLYVPYQQLIRASLNVNSFPFSLTGALCSSNFDAKVPS